MYSRDLVASFELVKGLNDEAESIFSEVDGSLSENANKIEYACSLQKCNIELFDILLKINKLIL